MLTWEATGVGSHPGEDHFEAMRMVFGEVPGLPYLPELPARGVGADMVGRTAALLVELPVEVQPSGWRFADRPGRDHQRAGRPPPARPRRAGGDRPTTTPGPLKLQVCGPWTLAASIELRHGDKMLVRPGSGARPDRVAGRRGSRDTCAEVRRRLPGVTEIVLQLDEPGLPGVLAGTVPTASGLRAAGRRGAGGGWRSRCRLFDASRSCTAARRRCRSRLLPYGGRAGHLAGRVPAAAPGRGRASGS